MPERIMPRFAPAAAFAALLLAGCAAQVPPVQVTRFHLDQPIAPGEIVVEPRDRRDADSLEFRNNAAIVRGELVRIGFRAAPDLVQSELVAVIDVARGSRQDLADRSGLSVGLGGGGFGSGVGVGGGVSFPIGRRRSNEILGTELDIQIKRRSEGTVIWEGRARTEARAGTPQAAPDAAIAHLAHALLTGFP
jgi:hypothetical protein